MQYQGYPLRSTFVLTIVACLLGVTPAAYPEQINPKTIKTLPTTSPAQGAPTPKSRAAEVKPVSPTAPSALKPQINVQQLGPQAAITVKSPAQGVRHPANTPLVILWDKNVAGAAPAVNILLVDKPGGTTKAVIKTGAPNTGSFTTWIPPQHITAAGTSWVVQIETPDKKLRGHSGVFSVTASPQPQATTSSPPVQVGNPAPAAQNITANNLKPIPPIALSSEPTLPAVRPKTSPVLPTQPLQPDSPQMKTKDLPAATGRRVVNLDISYAQASQVTGRRVATLNISADAATSGHVGRRVVNLDIVGNPTVKTNVGRRIVTLDISAF